MRFPTGFVPVLPLRNVVIFPGVSQMISVGRPRSLKALRRAQELSATESTEVKGASESPLKEPVWVLAVAQKNGGQRDDLHVDDLFEIGTLCRVESVRGSPDSGFQIVLRGIGRIRLTGLEERDGYFHSMQEPVDDQIDANESTLRALRDSLKTLSKEILQLIPANTDQVRELVDSVEDLSYLTSLSAANIEMPISVKQELLSEPKIKDRTMRLLQVMQELKENLGIQSEIRSKLSTKIGESHRQNMLREQLKTIREELGEGEDTNLVEGLRERIAKAQLPPDAQKQADTELKRLEQINPQSPEHNLVRTYLELLADLPWSKSAPEHDIDLDQARNILERDHHGLEKVKKRILQHLAVMKLKKTTRGSILLFVGPPGVGKTSLGQSIAEALGRKFARVSLGGVRDDAEIRGHRRTYVGALPGRVIASLKRAGENNPVILFDEIDKMARGYQGDPASAMLEVLDPEQNQNFVDTYLDVGFDLSKVFFIATANSLESIPPALLDRMEVIEVSGYTTAEKVAIARQHLLPKELLEHGMTELQLSLSDEVLLRVISGYTREAGVRELRRKLAEICRGCGEKVLTSTEPVRVSVMELDELLGHERFVQEVAEARAQPGVVTGLAWTPMGGDILFIESSVMPGTGQMTITGQLGDVMKESAQIAVSLLRARLSVLAPQVDFKKRDLHVHVPAGAIPKDGPSAGVTMLASLASVFSGRAVNTKLAMTGEVTLRGAVTPVGGIKEKVLAAHRAGIQELILPKRNERDLREVPEEIRAQLKVHFVEHVDQVLEIALQVSPAELAAAAQLAAGQDMVTPPTPQE